MDAKMDSGEAAPEEESPREVRAEIQRTGVPAAGVEEIPSQREGGIPGLIPDGVHQAAGMWMTTLWTPRTRMITHLTKE